MLQHGVIESASSTGYTISNSLRLRKSGGTKTTAGYLTYSNTTGVGNTFTISFWVKRGAIDGVKQNLIGITANGTTYLLFESDNTLVLRKGVSIISTTAVFRDPSAWYHIVLNSNAGSESLYVNNVLVSSPGINNIFLGSTLMIGANGGTGGDPFDGYLAEMHIIDGQALTPSNFGQVNSTTGVWEAKQYTGTYGTTGSYLKFSDIATTSGSNAGLGKDFSGNGNYWNTTNISVTAGTTYDSMTDVPTLSSSASNAATFNPIALIGSPVLSDGNLTMSTSGSNQGSSSTIAVTSGKWYFEKMTNNTGVNAGVINESDTLFLASATGGAGTNNLWVGIRLDADAKTADYTLNGSTWTTIGTISGNEFRFAITSSSTSARVTNLNFGQRTFNYTPPTGYVALNTYNLPDSTIKKGNKYIDATTYTGNGTFQSIVNAGAFQPDLVWIKSRSSSSFNHKLTDSVRGTTKALSSELTSVEATDSTGLTAFNSDGFRVNANTSYNTNTGQYIGWQWQAGQGSSSSNTNGSTTSTVSVNTNAGFSIVTYTGTSAAATVGHGLGVVPKLMMVKSKSGTAQDWAVYHQELGNTGYIVLNTNAGSATSGGRWNSTTPTSSVFSIGTHATTNASGNTYVAYCWAEVPGFSKFGSYTGNGSADGTFVYLGFRPKFVLIKNTAAASADDWALYDTSRDTTNLSVSYLAPSSINAESTAKGTLDILSNGFKLRNTNTGINSNGKTYIYITFAENPFKNSLAR